MGGIIGGVLGGAVGFVFGGPSGALLGASIGYGAGSMLDPQMPDAPGLGEVQKLSLPTSKEGPPVADALGLVKVPGNFIWYCCGHSEEIESGSGGKGGDVATGNNYYLTWAVGLCRGPVDELLSVWMGDECVWCGETKSDEAVAGGSVTVDIEDMGAVVFYFGFPYHFPNPTMTENLSTPAYSPGYTGTCYAVFRNCLIGNANRVPDVHFVFRKSPKFDFSPYEMIDKYRYNPAHAIWYILTELAGIPESMMDSVSFAESARVLFEEAHGIGILMDTQASALSYVESILNHIGGVIRYGTDGKLHLHLIRDNGDYWSLPQITADDVMEHPDLSGKAWLDTVNEVKIQYPQLWFGEFVAGRDVRDCDSFSPPTLTLDFCGDVVVLEALVKTVSTDHLTLTTDIDVSDYDMTGAVIWHKGISYEIITSDEHTLTFASAVPDIVAGDQIVIQTATPYEDACNRQGVYSVIGGCEPFHLYFRVKPNGKWKQVKIVRPQFVWNCTPLKCEQTELAIHDACGQDSCDLSGTDVCLGLTRQCNCGDASFSGGTFNLACGQTQLFSYGGSGTCCDINWNLSGVGTITPINASTVLYTAPQANNDGCCYGPSTLTVTCCETVLGTATINVNCGCDAASIGYTTLQMAGEEVQELTVEGASLTCAYEWALAGGGTLDVDPDGLGATYTAPATNPDCDNNAVITLSCCNAVVDTIAISINAYGNLSQVAYAIREIASCTEIWYPYPGAWRTEVTGTLYYYNCMGELICSYMCNLGDWGQLCPEMTYYAKHVGDTCYASGVTGAPGTAIDLRTPTMIANGCCPEALNA